MKRVGMERGLINSIHRNLNELPNHSSLRDFSDTKHESKSSFVKLADKRRADSTNTVNNTSSTDVCEEIIEFPAVVVKLYSGLKEDQECGADIMEQINTDGSQQETKVMKESLLAPKHHTSLAETKGANSEKDEVAAQESTVKCCFLPNIELPCTQCGEVLNVCLLSSHRNLHSALRKFRYAYEQKPQRLQCLVNRRRRLIKAVQESNLEKNQGYITDNCILALDTAFEIIKADIEGRPHPDEIDVNCALLPKAKGIHLACVTAVGLCVEGNEDWKHMEDAHAYHDNFLEGTESCYFGIYDGYFGRTSAQLCAEKLHVFLKSHLDMPHCGENGELNKHSVVAAFKSAYAEIEKMLLSKGAEEERSHHRWSGCSAVTCVLTRTKCYLANLGNVGAMLLRSNDVVRVLTRKHDLYDKRERDRVRKSSGVIVKTAKSALVNGALGVTRGIGNIGDGALRSCVINEPRIKTMDLDITDQMIVLASSGLWRTFSYEEVVYLINGFFQQINNEVKKCSAVSKNTSTESTVSVAQKRRYSIGLTGDRVKKRENGDLLKSYNGTCTKTSLDKGGKRRYSLFSHHETRLYLKSHDPPQLLSIKNKACLLAKVVSQRLVQSALLAGSKDNITVFVVLLPGFSLVSLDTFTPTLIPYINAAVDAQNSS